MPELAHITQAYHHNFTSPESHDSLRNLAYQLAATHQLQQLQELEFN